MADPESRARRGEYTTPENISAPEETASTRFICKVCGKTFDDQKNLKDHVDAEHEQKRTVTASEVIQKVFDGKINLPKTKSELVKYVEENKDRKSLPPDIVDAMRKIPDRRYNDEADFARGWKQQDRESAASSSIVP